MNDFNNYNNLVVNADAPVLGGGNQQAVQTGATLEDGATSPQAGGIPMTWLFIAYAAIFLFMYLVMWRPQAKKRKELAKMQQSMQVGDNIVTNSGLFGKIVDIGEDVYVIEFGTVKGVRIPVDKHQIAGIREPKLTKSASN
ncbi:MAG: preprotein translocase subunit YajC [Defluviitaleaceae bacterium]|nr:preprotein translocase subunit YajC [Defluviitaleaceae bacterium]